jgi:UvrB/uvrC motif
MESELAASPEKRDELKELYKEKNDVVRSQRYELAKEVRDKIKEKFDGVWVGDIEDIEKWGAKVESLLQGIEGIDPKDYKATAIGINLLEVSVLNPRFAKEYEKFKDGAVQKS